MDYNFNNTFPFQWGNSYIGNGFNTSTGQAHQQAQHAGLPTQTITPHPGVPAVTPTPAAPQPLFTVTPNINGNQATVTSISPSTHMPGVPSYSGIVNPGVYPFPVNGMYPNSQNPHFPTGWNFGYNITRFPTIETANAGQSILQDSKPNIQEGTQTNNISGQGTSGEKGDNSKDSQINEDLLAMKVTSFLSNSGVLKDVITKSLKSDIPTKAPATKSTLNSVQSISDAAAMLSEKKDFSTHRGTNNISQLEESVIDNVNSSTDCESESDYDVDPSLGTLPSNVR